MSTSSVYVYPLNDGHVDARGALFVPPDSKSKIINVVLLGR
jgi:hypothetical protein